MPQMQLPIFPAGLTAITNEIGFQEEAGEVVYFHGHLPVFQHEAGDLQSFRLITSQMIEQGTVSQADIVKAFGVPLITVKRYAKLLREGGTKAFFAPRKRRPNSVLKGEVSSQAQALLDEGKSVPEMARELGVLATTLHKAIRAGRLVKKKELTAMASAELAAMASAEPAAMASAEPAAIASTEPAAIASAVESAEPARTASAGSTQSERSESDALAPMGYGATRTLERVAAAMGQLERAPIEFHSAGDVPMGGVLLAVPALLAMGLMRHSLEFYALPKGYYGLSSILLLLALMALGRVKSIEQLRYGRPGEWGNLLGLDRIPEVRTLRAKLKLLCRQAGLAARWNIELAKEWMGLRPEAEPMFYVDGHVRVYHGKLTPLPKHYVARQRLYQRATVDYWVNALDGQPFFYINQVIDHGLVQALREDIVPWVEANAPVSAEHQQRMDADALVPKFTVVFDREGYSPDLFAELQQRRIAVLSYHRYPSEDWRVEEFAEQTLTLANGETVKLQLAERGTRQAKGPWMREVRKLSENGKQTSVISTHPRLEAAALAASLFARWAQENFFRYMRQHYELDALAERGTEPIADTEVTVNPAWRMLDREVRKKRAVLIQERARFEGVSLTEPLGESAVNRYQVAQGEQRQKIEQLEKELDQIKQERKATKHHVPVKDLPEKDRFSRLLAERKHFIDTIKMISYRAETSMVSIVREKMARADDARSLLRQIYDTEVDLVPNPEAGTLTVRLHHLTQAAHDEVARHLCDQLNETETIFPDTKLRLVFRVGSS